MKREAATGRRMQWRNSSGYHKHGFL